MTRGRSAYFLSESPLLPEIKKICRYCISGGTGAALDFAIYSVLIYFFSTYYLISNLISFSCGTAVTYYLQKNWTFRYETTRNLAVFQRYMLAVVATYILNNALLFTFVGILAINVFAAKILQIILSTFWAYTINSMYVFKKNERCPE